MYLRLSTAVLLTWSCFGQAPNANPTTPADASWLESKLAFDPDDVPARSQLIRYYFQHADAASGPSRVKHVLWLIEHHPEADVLSGGQAAIERTGSLADPDAYARAEKLWRAQAAKADASPAEMVNAIAFFRIADPALARKISDEGLRRYPADARMGFARGVLDVITILGATGLNSHAAYTDPSGGTYGPISAFDDALAQSEASTNARKELETTTNPDILGAAGMMLEAQVFPLVNHNRGKPPNDALQLAETCFNRAMEIDPSKGEWRSGARNLYSTEAAWKTSPSEKLELYEKAMQLASTDDERWYLLSDRAEAYFNTGKIDKATADANELLRMAAERANSSASYRRSDWNYGNAIHNGNIILGRAALKKGDVAEAARRLLEAGRTPGSPQLNSFGPKWTLASELMARGQTQPVLAYIDLCRSFWKMDAGRLDGWASTIRTGGYPNFNAPPTKSAAPLLGQAAPEFRLKDLAGKQIGLSDYKGKIVLVDFWATWCAPCRGEMPYFEKLQQEFGGKEVAILAVDAGEEQDVVESFIKKEKYTFPVLLSNDQQVSAKYNVNAFPTLVVVDAAGKVADYIVGGRSEEDLRAEVVKARKGAPLSAAAAAETPADFYRDGARLRRESKYAEAIAAYTRAIAARKDWPQALFARGQCHYALKQYADALVDFNEVIRLDPGMGAAYLERGLCYSYTGHHDRAMPDYARAMELLPENPRPHNARGWAYLELGQYDDALEDLNKAIDLDPSLQIALENRVNLFMKTGAYDKAAADCDAILRLNPNASWAGARRIEARTLAGKVAGAAPLHSPKLLSPPPGAVFDHYPRETTVVWEKVPDAAAYVVEWDYRDDAGWVSERNGMSATMRTTDLMYTFDFVGAQPGRCRIWAVDAAGRPGAKSEWREFRYTR